MIRILLVISVFLPSAFFAQGPYNQVAEQLGIGNITGGHGIAIADYDNDGFEDIFIARLNEPNVLLRNNQNNTFEAVKVKLDAVPGSLSKVGIWGDIDNDGDQDFFLGVENGNHQLFENKGDGSFENISSLSGVNKFGTCENANFADFNGDALLDIYLTNLLEENALFINQGNNIFSDEIQNSGASSVIASINSLAADFDKDGDQDLFITHNESTFNSLLSNDGTGKFVDISLQSDELNFNANSTGTNISDFNNDGYFDYFVNDDLNGNLLRGSSNGACTNTTDLALVNNVGLGSGVLFLDFNNDSWEDLYMVRNNSLNVLFQNLTDGTFENISATSSTASEKSGRAVAKFDFNKNGKLDMILSNSDLDEPIEFFRNNDGSGNNWIQVDLEGVNSNRDAIGARVEFIDDRGNTRMQTITAGAGFASQSSKILHFGLGTSENIDELMVYWPSGLVENVLAPPTNRRIEILEGQGIVNGLDDPSLNQDFSVGPNPTTQDWHIRFNLDQTREVQLRLFDIAGRLVTDKGLEKFTAGSYDEKISLPSKGIFVAHLTVDGEQFSWRVTKL